MDRETALLLPATYWVRRGKRIADLVGGGLLLVLCSPLMLFAGVLIKATSPGPIFFRQIRAGKDGKPFVVIKFRTMRGDRAPDPKELVPLDHAEITSVGRLLRRLKIDELPQLFNVLKGEMSVVGPRPTLLDQVASYDSLRRQRLLVKPGLTGLAQVYSSAAASWDERIAYDIAYVRMCSPLLDLSVVLRTILVIFMGEKRTSRDFSSTRFSSLTSRVE